MRGFDADKHPCYSFHVHLLLQINFIFCEKEDLSLLGSFSPVTKLVSYNFLLCKLKSE